MQALIVEAKREPREISEKIFHEGLKILYRDSLFVTAKDLLGYKDINERTHGEMVKVLEDPSTRKLIVLPRGCFKSSIGVVAYSIWTLMRDPNARILIDSEVYTNSKNFLREIKAHLKSKDFVDVFGDWQGDIWTEGEIVIKPRTKNYKEASITCGGIGTIKVGQHFDVIIGDDLNSNNNSNTSEGCAKVIAHYRMNQAILDPTGVYVVIGTRYSAGDLIQFILDNEVNAKGLVIP